MGATSKAVDQAVRAKSSRNSTSDHHPVSQYENHRRQAREGDQSEAVDHRIAALDGCREANTQAR